MDPSLYAYPDVDRPWVRVNFVSTVDGGAWDSDHVTGSLGGDVDTETFALLRSLADVIVVGAGTARLEKYGPDSPAPIAVVTRSGNVPPGLHHVIAPAEGETEIDWTAVLADFEERGWRKVLCEGGPHLFGTLIDLDLVDDVCLTVAPTLVAGQASRISVSSFAQDRPLRLAHAVAVGDVLLTRWIRDRST